MKCVYCGAELPDSAGYCDKCGKPQLLRDHLAKGAVSETVTRPKTHATRSIIRFLGLFNLIVGVLTLFQMFSFPMIWYNLTRFRDGTLDAYLGIFFGGDSIVLAWELLWRRNRKWTEYLILANIGILLIYINMYYSVHINEYYPAQYWPVPFYLAVILFQAICFWYVRQKLEVAS